MTVMQYDREFCKLARFAPGLVATEKERVKRFITGLRPIIQKDLSILEFTTCAEILNKALKLEKGYTQLQVQNYQGERKRSHPENQHYSKRPDEKNNKNGTTVYRINISNLR